VNNGFILVYETYDSISAGLLKAKLTDEDIPFTLTGENEIGFPRLALKHLIKFYVYEDYYELALTVINTDRSSFLNDNLEY
jgi:hypothetical protein